jgi:hypothetical protein
MKSHHCRHCGDPRDLLKPSYRRWNLERLYAEVRSIILAKEENSSVTAEDLGTQLRARKHLVEICFARLNLEGLLSQGVNRAPHDSTRDPWMQGSCFTNGDSAWQATYYIVRKKQNSPNIP